MNMARPFLPSDSAFQREHEQRRHPPRTYLERACFAATRHALQPYHDGSVVDVAREIWPHDEVTQLVLKASSAPATTTTSGWASQLAVNAVGDFISNLAPLSAAARLFEIAPRVSLSGLNTVSFPARAGAIDPAAMGFVAQGAPIPVIQSALNSVSLGPTHKIAAIVELTRETAESGAGETALTTMLKESAARSLDANLFSTTAGSADRPAGLLAGIAAQTASTGTGNAAMLDDLSLLANVISDDAADLAFVMHPGQARAVQLRSGAVFPTDIQIWPSLGIAEGVVIAVSPSAIVSGFDAAPEIVASQEAVLHQETAPAQIGTPGSPNTVAAPTRSLWQTDVIALRLILKAAWALRAPGVAWIQNVAW